MSRARLPARYRRPVHPCTCRPVESRNMGIKSRMPEPFLNVRVMVSGPCEPSAGPWSGTVPSALKPRKADQAGPRPSFKTAATRRRILCAVGMVPLSPRAHAIPHLVLCSRWSTAIPIMSSCRNDGAAGALCVMKASMPPVELGHSIDLAGGRHGQASSDNWG
jgi:hypothetical protein